MSLTPSEIPTLIKSIAAGAALAALMGLGSVLAEEHVPGPALYAMCAGSNRAGVEVYAAGMVDALKWDENSALSRGACIPEGATPAIYAEAICRTVSVAPEITDQPTAYIVSYSLAAAFPCGPDHDLRLEELFPDMPPVHYE